MSGDDNTRPLTSTHYFYFFYRNAESPSTTQARKDQMIYVFQCAATDLHYIYMHIYSIKNSMARY